MSHARDVVSEQPNPCPDCGEDSLHDARGKPCARCELDRKLTAELEARYPIKPVKDWERDLHFLFEGARRLDREAYPPDEEFYEDE